MQRSLIPDDLTIEEMISRVEEEGYVVKKVKKYKSISTDCIISMFYDRLEELFGPAFVLSCKDKRNLSANRETLKKFRQKVINEGFTERVANLIAYSLIKLVFDNYDKIGLKNPITTLDFLLTKKGSWMFSKLVEIDIRDRDKLEDSNWFREKIHQMCSTDDCRLEELRKLRDKEIRDYHAKKEKTN